MARSSCVVHPANDRFIQIRQSYMQLTDSDPIEAALLHLFEFWTNGKLEHISEGEEPWIIGKTTEKIAQAMIGAFSTRSIKDKLQKLRDRGLLHTRQPVAHRKTLDYLLDVDALQQALNALSTNTPSAATSPDSKKAKGKSALGNEKAKGKSALGSQISKCKSAPAPYIEEIQEEEEDLKTKEGELDFVFEQTSPFQNSTVLTEEKEQPQTQTDDPKSLKESSANFSQKKITTARWRETGKLGKHGYPNVVNMQGSIVEILPWIELNDTLRSGYGFNPEFEAFVSKQQVKKKYFSDMRPGEFVAAIKDWIGRAATDEERFGQVMRRWEMFERNLADEGTKTVKELYQESEKEKRWQAIAQSQPMPTEPQPAKPERKKLTIKDAM